MFKTLAAAIVATLFAATADAATLRFSGLGATQYLTSYTEQGYTLTASSPSSGTHIGDVGPNNTFDWHGGGSNAYHQSWTLTRNDGGNFRLSTLYIGSNDRNDTMYLTNSNGGSANLYRGWAQAVTSTWQNVSWVRFTVSRREHMWLDNVSVHEVAAVPGPAALPLAASGLALLGFAGWRRRKA